MKGLILCFLWASLFSAQAFAADPLLQWVENTSKKNVSAVSKSFNPGFLALDETELRVEFSERFQTEKQSLRFSLKPLAGLSNEYKLSKQRSKVVQTKNQIYQQMNRFYAYSQLIQAWRVSKSSNIIRQSARVFNWVKANIKPHLRRQSLDNDSTRLVMSLADFMNTKSKVETRKNENLTAFASGESEAGSVLKSIESLRLLNVQTIAKQLQHDNKNLDSMIEAEEKKLRYFELQQKKREAYQIIKFISVQREEQRDNGVGYASQVSFRVPFLSDSEELRSAEADFAVAQNNYELTKYREGRELDNLKSEILGLIERYKVLQMLPKSSFSMRKIKNKISSVSDIARGESDHLKAQLNLIDTRSLIIENYLLYLVKSSQLSQSDVNYLTQLPPSTTR